jgi:hypothetical protein
MLFSRCPPKVIFELRDAELSSYRSCREAELADWLLALACLDFSRLTDIPGNLKIFVNLPSGAVAGNKSGCYVVWKIENLMLTWEKWTLNRTKPGRLSNLRYRA